MTIRNFFRVYFLPAIIFLISTCAYCLLFMQNADKISLDSFLEQNLSILKPHKDTTLAQDTAPPPSSAIPTKPSKPIFETTTSLDQDPTTDEQLDNDAIPSNTTDTNTSNTTREPFITTFVDLDPTISTPESSTMPENTDTTQEDLYLLATPAEEPLVASQEIDAPLSVHQTYYINVKTANVRKRTDPSAPIVKRLYFGQAILVESIQDDWAKVSPKGFILYSLLSQTQPIKPFYVAPMILNVREKPSLNARIINTLHLNEEILIRSISNGWAELDSGGFVSVTLIKESL